MTYTKRIPLAARRAACLTPVVPLPHWRAFLFTPCARAAEPDDTIYHNFKNTSIFHKISEKPEALAALRDFGTLLDEKGVDPTLGPPSTTKMLQLAASSDFRQAAQRVIAELQNAGVDLTSKDVLQKLMALSKKPEDS